MEMTQTDRDDLLELLRDVAAYLDDHADVRDGESGPVANRAMALHLEVQDAIGRIEGGRDGT